MSTMKGHYLLQNSTERKKERHTYTDKVHFSVADQPSCSGMPSMMTGKIGFSYFSIKSSTERFLQCSFVIERVSLMASSQISLPAKPSFAHRTTGNSRKDGL